MIVEILPSVVKEFKALPVNIQRQIAGKIDSLAKNPFPAGYKALKGEDICRIRSGDYRILYVVNKSANVLTIAKIRHRKDAYRGL